jgi:hypothetical protein
MANAVDSKLERIKTLNSIAPLNIVKYLLFLQQRKRAVSVKKLDG